MDKQLQNRLLSALVGRPLVSNAFRGTLVEAMLSQALEPHWRWLADGWGCYDFENESGVGLEVKQSAALQDWHGTDARPNPGRFDIAARAGRYVGASWVAAPGRAAAIYVFAWHPIVDGAVADHRDPTQWEFYPVAARKLPQQKTLGLAGVRRLSDPVGIGDVANAVHRLTAASSE